MKIQDFEGAIYAQRGDPVVKEFSTDAKSQEVSSYEEAFKVLLDAYKHEWRPRKYAEFICKRFKDKLGIQVQKNTYLGNIPAISAMLSGNFNEDECRDYCNQMTQKFKNLKESTMTTRFKKFLEDSHKFKKLHEARLCRDGKCSEIEEAKRICEEAGLTVSKKPRFGIAESSHELDEAKGINTNTRAFQTKVQQHIKDNFEDVDWIDVLKTDVEHFVSRRNPSIYHAAYQYANDGNFDMYNNEVIETMSDWFECSEDEIEKYYKGNTVRMFDVYCHLCARAVEAIITGVKCYVK